MPINYSVVVSSENTPYMAWQTQLFCFSAITRLKQFPIVVVHETDGPIMEDFLFLQEKGCRLIVEPSYRRHPTGPYPARNELGSLLAASRLFADHDASILFCEPDMLFTAPYEISPSLAGEHYSYLNYHDSRFLDVWSRVPSSITPDLLNECYRIGVPYCIPSAELARLSARWIRELDQFTTLEWIDIMYAFGLAASLEGLLPVTRYSMDDNFTPTGPSTKPLIHYCYGDATWSKRDYFEGAGPLKDKTPLPPAMPGSINAELFSQIDEARTAWF